MMKSMRTERRPAVRRVASAVLAAAGVLACGGGSGSGSDGGTVAAARTATTDGTPASAAANAGGPSIGSGVADGGCDSATVRALLVGTSLTAGYGLEADQAFPALLQRKADSAGFAVDIVNAGVSGETSAAALRRADWIFRGPADVIMLETGANDGLRGLDPDATRRNIVEILGKARATHPSARLLLVQMEAPPNLGAGYTSRFRAMFPAVARETGATLVPFLLDGVAGRPELNQGDGIHPNVAGSRVVAANVWPALRGALASLDRCSGSK